MHESKDALSGVLTFYSETGTEGGHWAFQDSRFISENTTRFHCKKCGLYWDTSIETELEVQEKAKRFGGRNDLMYCAPAEHEFQLVSKQNWSYDGLHILEDGDFLSIRSPYDGDVVWEGQIQLKKYPSFQEHINGLYIHSDQKGVERTLWSQWFFGQYTCLLKKKNT